MSSNKPGARWGCGWFWLAVGLLAVGAAFALDDAVDGRLYPPAHETSSQMAVLVSKYGDWPPALLAGLVIVTALVGCRKMATARLVLLILVAGLLTGLASDLLRAAVGRTRPTATAPQGFYGLRYQGKWIVGKYQFSSFPSGHTAVWAGLAGAAWFRRRTWGVALLAVAVVVAWSRIALGCHHFSDVTASVVWGFALGPWLCRRLESGTNKIWSKMGLPL
jgi:membrane-associated phospholipid phosphatase